MTKDNPTTLTQEQKIAAFKDHFLAAVSGPFERWKNELELALAMGDEDVAAKEKIKVDVMRHVEQLCEDACREASLKAVIRRFGSRIGAIKEVLQQRIDEARATGLKEQEIKLRIELGIYDAPVAGFLKAALRTLGEDALIKEFTDSEA